MEPTLPEMIARSPTFAAWWAAVQGTDGCWEWTGSLRGNGYGQVCIRPKNWLLHRLVYALCVGPLDSALTIDHLCRNRKCGNPAHLEQVTSIVNTMRGETPARRYARRTHCNHGHPFTPENLYWRIAGAKRIRQCRTCAIQKASADNKRRRDVLSARRVERYRTDPAYRENAKAIQRAYHARKTHRLPNANPETRA
jgi:hypothetical protein